MDPRANHYLKGAEMSTETDWKPEVGSQWTSRVYGELWEVEKVYRRAYTDHFVVTLVNPKNHNHFTAVGLNKFTSIYDPVSQYDTRKLVAWKKLVEAFNTLEFLGQDMAPTCEEYPLLGHDFRGGDYSIAWNSETNRWELVSETTDAPEVD